MLAAGVSDAANGTAEIYRRGTSTFATLYANYDGTGAVTPTGGIALDANGRAEWFVNEEVDVIIRNSGATALVSTNPMESAANVEVRSQSFTGTDYDTAATGASKAITLAAVLDLLRTSFGARDFKVLIGSTEYLLTEAFSLVSGFFFNVKATTYNAKGDNSTDDTSAIQAAIDAATNAGGGIVFFPAGTYRITSALNLKLGVSLLGAGANAAAVTIDHASNNAITVAAGTANQTTFIRGLRITASQANSGKHVVVESGTVISISECTIGSASNTTGTCVSIANAASFVRASDSEFLHAGTGAGARGISAAATGGAMVRGCRFTAPATWNGKLIELAAGGIVTGNIIDLSASTAGAGGGVYLTGSTFGVAAIGNHFPTPGSTGVGQFGGTMALGAAELNSNTDASFPGPTTTPGTTNATHAGSVSLMREGLREYQSDDSPILLIGFQGCKTSEVRRTTAANQQLILGAPGQVGIDATLVFNNDQGAGSGTITVTTCVGLANFTVNANKVSHYFMRAVENVAAGGGSSSLRWMLVSSLLNQNP